MNGLETPPPDPMTLYREWMREAEANEPNDPNAAALATASTLGIPTVRMVLIKHAEADGFWFFTNDQSEKGIQLLQNPHAALCLHWKSLRRQIRVSGPVTTLSPEESDQYFHSRSRISQAGAAVSQQSRPLSSREWMEKTVERFAVEHPGEIPRPPHWHGFSILPERMEFWADGPDRLHDRIAYARGEEGWEATRLWP